MGVLSDVFIASEAELTPDLLERGPLGMVPAVEGKGLTEGAVRELATALGIEARPEKLFLEPLGRGGSGGQCICRVGDEIVRALAASDEQEQARVRERWVGPQKPDGLGMKSDGEIWFEDVAALMRRAVAEGKGAYVWFSP